VKNAFAKFQTWLRKTDEDLLNLFLTTDSPAVPRTEKEEYQGRHRSPENEKSTAERVETFRIQSGWLGWA
jgi:hypothetical protein